jgi:5-methylcytosine-specific restriction endonuclease McrA
VKPDHWSQVARELNSITQLSRDSANSEKITRHVERVRQLVKGEAGQKSNPKPTRRRLLWRKDPCCFWRGRVTRFDAYREEDAATVEHIYSRRHPKRGSVKKHLPSHVLACRRCNSSRGAPEAREFDECPLTEAERRLKS